MFKSIMRTLSNIARASIQPAQRVAPSHTKVELTARELAFTGRGKGKKHSHKKGNAAQLKRASKKASNIRKWG